MSLHEDLSRLLDGELAPAEADALRTRIASDPEVREAWELMQRAVDGLAGLPRPAPPPHLDAQVLGEVPVAANRAFSWRPWAGWVAAAAIALLWLGLRTPTPDAILVSGDQWVDGDVKLLAGDATIDLDGRAWISVEPPAGVSRVPAMSEEDAMNKSQILAAVAGAAVTVAVYEGVALVTGPADAHAVTVSAGETHTVAPLAAAHGVERRVRVKPAPIPEGETPQQTISRLQGEVATLSQALAEEQFKGELTRGQLLAHQGEEQQWPSAVPAGFDPDEFEGAVTAAVASVPQVQIEAIDCTEYPCIAALRVDDLSDGWTERYAEIPKQLHEDTFGEDEAGLAVWVAGFEDDGNEAGVIGFAFLPKGEDGHGDDEAVTERTSYRTDAMIKDIGHDIAGDEGTHDEDVEFSD